MVCLRKDLLTFLLLVAAALLRLKEHNPKDPRPCRLALHLLRSRVERSPFSETAPALCSATAAPPAPAQLWG